jgi:hypothetical protein
MSTLQEYHSAFLAGHVNRYCLHFTSSVFPTLYDLTTNSQRDGGVVLRFPTLEDALEDLSIIGGMFLQSILFSYVFVFVAILSP